MGALSVDLSLESSPAQDLSYDLAGKTANSVAIVGTRKPTNKQIQSVNYFARYLSETKDCIIKTGGARGIDHAAMLNTVPVEKLEVYLPWPSYNRDIIPNGCKRILIPAASSLWIDSVHTYHPNPGALTQAAVLLHARNYGIVAKSKLVMAFPELGESGGTGQAIRVARALSIPCLVYDARAVYTIDEVMSLIVDLLG